MVRLSKINTNAPLFKKFNTPLRLFPFGKGLFFLLFVHLARRERVDRHLGTKDHRKEEEEYTHQRKKVQIPPFMGVE